MPSLCAFPLFLQYMQPFFSNMSTLLFFFKVSTSLMNLTSVTSSLCWLPSHSADFFLYDANFLLQVLSSVHILFCILFKVIAHLRSQKTFELFIWPFTYFGIFRFSNEELRSFGEVTSSHRLAFSCFLCFWVVICKFICLGIFFSGWGGEDLIKQPKILKVLSLLPLSK